MLTYPYTYLPLFTQYFKSSLDVGVCKQNLSMCIFPTPYNKPGDTKACSLCVSDAALVLSVFLMRVVLVGLAASAAKHAA